MLTISILNFKTILSYSNGIAISNISCLPNALSNCHTVRSSIVHGDIAYIAESLAM